MGLILYRCFFNLRVWKCQLKHSFPNLKRRSYVLRTLFQVLRTLLFAGQKRLKAPEVDRNPPYHRLYRHESDDPAQDKNSGHRIACVQPLPRYPASRRGLHVVCIVG